MTSTAPVATPSKFARWASLGGAAFVVLFVAGTVLFFSGNPGNGVHSNQDKVRAYWADSGHRNKLHYGWILIALGVLALLWFVAALRQRFRDADTGNFYGTLIAMGGTVYAVTTLVAFSLEDAVKTMSDDTVNHTVYPELIHAVDDSGWVIHASGGVGMATLIIATSLAARRIGAWSSWVVWLSFVAGVLTLGLVAFFPDFVMLLWLLIASIAMFVRSGKVAASP